MLQCGRDSDGVIDSIIITCSTESIAEISDLCRLQSCCVPTGM